MSTTLARRIRRIGILPTTYKHIEEKYLIQKDDGTEFEATRVKEIPVHHFSPLSKEEKAKVALSLTLEHRAARKARTTRSTPSTPSVKKEKN